jgi:hypothetical protein
MAQNGQGQPVEPKIMNGYTILKAAFQHRDNWTASAAHLL